MSLSWGMLLIVIAALALASCASPRRSAIAPCLLEDSWRSFDGKVMPFQKWGTGQPRAVVIAVHGLSGAASDFWPPGEHLAAAGIHLYAYDLRGQGRDPKPSERGHIRRTRLWRQDLQTFATLLQERHPHAPQFWMGESLGSLIVLHTATTQPLQPALAGIILSSPVAGLRNPLPAGKRWQLELAARFLPRKRVTLGGLAGVDESTIQVTSSTTHGGQMAVTPHHVSSFSTRLLSEMGQWMDATPNAARQMPLPLLMLASPNDVVSSAAQIETLFGHFRSDSKSLRWYPRSHHLLMHDVERAQVVADLSHWLQSQMASAGKIPPAN